MPTYKCRSKLFCLYHNLRRRQRHIFPDQRDRTHDTEQHTLYTHTQTSSFTCRTVVVLQWTVSIKKCMQRVRKVPAQDCVAVRVYPIWHLSHLPAPFASHVRQLLAHAVRLRSHNTWFRQTKNIAVDCKCRVSNMNEWNFSAIPTYTRCSESSVQVSRCTEARITEIGSVDVTLETVGCTLCVHESLKFNNLNLMSRWYCIYHKWRLFLSTVNKVWNTHERMSV